MSPFLSGPPDLPALHARAHHGALLPSPQVRGPPEKEEVHGARKEELAERGQGAETDLYAPGVNVTSELTMMSELLLAPAAALLTPETPLLIVTHLSLQWVPFCALPLPATHPASTTPSSVRTGACLVDVHPISFAPSLTVYRHLVHRAALAAADTAPAPLDESLVVGGAIPSPSYELPDLPVRHSSDDLPDGLSDDLSDAPPDCLSHRPA